MLSEELADFMDRYPWLKKVRIPPGGNRMDSLDLRARRLEFLLPGGEIMDLPPSNVVLITLHTKPIAWRKILDSPLSARPSIPTDQA